MYKYLLYYIGALTIAAQKAHDGLENKIKHSRMLASTALTNLTTKARDPGRIFVRIIRFRQKVWIDILKLVILILAAGAGAVGPEKACRQRNQKNKKQSQSLSHILY